MNPQAVAWNNVSYSVRSGFWLHKKRIVSDLDLVLPQGSVLGLVGPNGAGKTTSIKLGAGIIEPDQGEVLVFDRPASTLQAKSLLGVLTELQYFYPNLRVYEWLLFLAQLSGLSDVRFKKGLDTLLDCLELDELLGQQMSTLSKGQLQRVGLAQALVHEPEILLLDEPMSGLDPYWRYRFQQILKEQHARGKTILLSTHILHDIENLCDCIALMENCRVRWSGAISELSGQVKYYEVTAWVKDADIVHYLVPNGDFEETAEGEYIFLIPVHYRDYVHELVTQGRLVLTSLRPLHQNLEELLFEISE